MQNLRAAFHHSAGTCSMKGKRLPELVAGSFNQYFDRVCEVALTELMMGCRVHFSEEQWAIVLQNFVAGKAVSWGGFKVKTNFVKRLPWQLAGIAHYDESTARQIARDILDYFDGQDGSAQQMHHGLTLQALSAASLVRAEFFGFCGRCTLAHPCRLSHACATFQICTDSRAVHRRRS